MTEDTIERPQMSTLDSLKRAFAEHAYGRLREKFGTELSGNDLLSIDSLFRSIERPRKPEFGDLALPLFPFVKVLKTPPPKLYESLFAEVRIDPSIGEISFAGGYANLSVNAVNLAGSLLSEALESDVRYGSSTVGHGERILVEFSSPNIAKPFGIGHLRSTVVGASLARIFEFLGYETLRINYLGDWGTQFGKMITAYKRWDGERVLAENEVHGALDLYVRFHKEEGNDPSLTEDARAEFKKLEDGDPEAVRLWKMFKDVSQKEFERVYGTLGITFDVVTGESELNERMSDVIRRLDNAGLTSVSRGALVVDLEDYGLPPCLLKKQDGATLYATRDIAGMVYRWETYPFNQSLYVVGASQADHFKQVYKVVELLEEAEQAPGEQRMSGRVKHVPFGWVKFEDKALSTRSGNIIVLDDVLQKTISLAREKIAEKNPDLSNSAEIAERVGVGAIIFSQLAVRRQKDVNFSWEAALSFEGETGPYLQYTHARLSSLLRKYGKQIPSVSSLHLDILSDAGAKRLLMTLARFPEVTLVAAREYEPFEVSSYLLELSSQFNSFYQQRDEKGDLVRIISDDSKATDARMALVSATRSVIASGLMLLGLRAPEEM